MDADSGNRPSGGWAQPAPPPTLDPGPRVFPTVTMSELEVRDVPPAERSGGARSVFAVLMLLVAVLLAPLALVAVWADGLVTDRDHYVSVTSALADDPAVQGLIADRATGEVMANLDVEALTSARLDALADRLGLPGAWRRQLQDNRGRIEAAVRAQVRTLAGQAVRSDEFADLWGQAAGQVYDQVVGVIRTPSEADALARAEAIVLRLDLQTLLRPVRRQLAAVGLDTRRPLGQVAVRVSVGDETWVREARTAFADARWGARWLPVACLALLVGGLLLARRRWRALAWTAGLACVPMLALWGLTRAATDVAARVAHGPEISEAAVRSVAAAATGLLTGSIRTAVIVLVVVAVTAGAVAVGLAAGRRRPLA